MGAAGTTARTRREVLTALATTPSLAAARAALRMAKGSSMTWTKRCAGVTVQRIEHRIPVLIVSGKGYVPCVSCHRDGTFTYWCPVAARWVHHAAVVPSTALHILPEAELVRVVNKMRVLGRVA